MKYKDPTTGNFKELKIRATDELPVGSEIDVDDNTTIPAGWQIIPDTSGTDANEGYIKFSEGIMICWGISNNITLSSSEITGNISFPQTFTSAPLATISLDDPGPQRTHFTTGVGSSTTTTSISYKIKSVGDYSTSGVVNLRYIAIGRWK